MSTLLKDVSDNYEHEGEEQEEYEDDQNDQQDGGSGVPGELAVQVVVGAPRPDRGCAGGEG